MSTGSIKTQTETRTSVTKKLFRTSNVHNSGHNKKTKNENQFHVRNEELTFNLMQNVKHCTTQIKWNNSGFVIKSILNIGIFGTFHQLREFNRLIV